MLKFIKHHMDSIMGIEIYPLVSLLIFFTFFTVLIVWVVRSDNGFISSMANMPLDESEEDDLKIQNQEQA